MNVIITGAAGFLGTHLTRYLLNHGYNVTGIDNYAHPITDIGWHPRSPRREDVTNPKWLDELLFAETSSDENKGLAEIFPTDVIVHLAATISVNLSVEQPEIAVKNNILGILNVLEACRKHDLKLVFASSCEVYGSNQGDTPMGENHPVNPQSPYGVTKLAGELLCRTYRKIYGLQINVTRCFNFFGPYQREDDYGAAIAIFTRRVLNGESPVIWGDGFQTRDYTYVDDIVRAYDIAINNDFGDQPVNFCSGREVTISNLADMIINLGFLGHSDIGPLSYGPARKWELRRSWGDNSRAYQEFGWKPEVSLEDGLRKYVAWYKETHFSGSSTLGGV
jgi:UDP-glucose 4-epimerase